MDAEQPLVIPEAYRYTLEVGQPRVGCLAFCTTLLGVSLTFDSVSDWLLGQGRLVWHVALGFVTGGFLEALFPVSYLFDKDGIWRISRLQTTRRWRNGKLYQGHAKLLLRPPQVCRWESVRWKGNPSIVITAPDHEEVTICFRRDLLGSSQEWEVTKRLTEWAALPPADDDGELEIHWDEVPEELKRWV